MMTDNMVATIVTLKLLSNVTQKYLRSKNRVKYEGYRDGKFVKGNGRATNVFVKDKDNDWKLVHEHLSSLPT